MALSSRLAVTGQISVIIWPDIWYYPAGYPVLSGRISSIIWLDIRYYLAGYPVRQLAGYPNLALKNCRISGIRLSGSISISRISGIRLSGKITIRYIPNIYSYIYWRRIICHDIADSYRCYRCISNIIYQTNHTIANKCKPPLATLRGKLLATSYLHVELNQAEEQKLN